VPPENIDSIVGEAPNRTTVLRGVARYVAMLAIAILVIAKAAGGVAHAGDRIGELTKLLTSSSNEKTRLAAVVSLARLQDRRAMKPLVAALGDPSSKIRAVAAVALGRLGHKAALPSLKNLANDDSDSTVRARAHDAALAVARSNRLPNPFADAETTTPPPPARRIKAGFGNHPRALENHPDVYVVIKTSADDSPGRADKKTRKMHAEIIRKSLLDQCRATTNVTSVASEAARWGLDLRQVDLSVVKLAVTPSGGYMEVEAQLRLAISDDKGKMLSFVSGGAKVQVPRKTFNAKYLPNLRREALENAMRGMFDKLLAHLRDQTRA